MVFHKVISVFKSITWFTGSAQSDISVTSNPEVSGPSSSFPKVPANEWNETQVFMKAKWYWRKVEAQKTYCSCTRFNMSHVMKQSVSYHMRKTKLQISLRIRAVWSAPLFSLSRKHNTSRCHVRNFKSLATCRFSRWAGQFESYQVANLRRQVFSWHGSYRTK